MNGTKYLILLMLILGSFCCEKNNHQKEEEVKLVVSNEEEEEVEEDTILPINEEVLFRRWEWSATLFNLIFTNDVEVFDLYDSPWKGTVTCIVEDSVISSSSFDLYRGDHGEDWYWYGDSLNLYSRYPSGYSIETKSDFYILDDSGAMNENYLVQFNGLAYNNYDTTYATKTAEVNGFIYPETKNCEAGIAYTFKDGLRQLDYTICWIEFYEDGSYEGERIMMDFGYPISGNWIFDGQFLVLEDDLGKETFEVKIIDDELCLSEKVQVETYILDQLSIEKEDIAELYRFFILDTVNILPYCQ